MALSIKDEETDRLARAVAAATGQNLTEAIRDALRHRLDELNRDKQREAYKARLLALGKEVAAQMKPPFSSTDHGDLLYGPDGLPK